MVLAVFHIWWSYCELADDSQRCEELRTLGGGTLPDRVFAVKVADRSFTIR